MASLSQSVLCGGDDGDLDDADSRWRYGLDIEHFAVLFVNRRSVRLPAKHGAVQRVSCCSMGRGVWRWRGETEMRSNVLECVDT